MECNFRWKQASNIIPGNKYECSSLHPYVPEPVIILYLQPLHNPISQHDNVRPYTAAVTTRFLFDCQVTSLPWPAESPDLSPTEHMGGRLDQLSG